LGEKSGPTETKWGGGQNEPATEWGGKKLKVWKGQKTQAKRRGESGKNQGVFGQVLQGNGD